MKKIFVSQPMNELSEEQIEKDHAEIVEKLQELFGEDIEVHWCNIPIVEGKGRLYYWGAGLQEMDGCDIYCNVVNMYSNGIFNGCQLEEMAARTIGLTIIQLHFDKQKMINGEVTPVVNDVE